MTIESEIFKRCTPDFKLLKNYGFTLLKDKYTFEKNFMNDEFKAIVEIHKSGEINAKVYDTENNEEYLPIHIKGEIGSFTASIKTEYTKILEEICANCFTKNYFNSPQSNRIARELYKNFGDNPEFLWKEYPTFGIFRKPETGKWYGALMNVDYKKFAKNLKGEVDIINVKLPPEIIVELIDCKNYYPAYHMNKKYWITIVLNDTLSDEEVMKYIKISRELV